MGILIGLALLTFNRPAASQSLAQAPAAVVESVVMVQTIAPIRPVLAADGLVHLVYELLLINQSGVVATVDAIAVLDADSRSVLKEYAGADIAATMRVTLLGGNATTLQPSQSAFVFLDVAMPADGVIPRSVLHRISITRAQPAEFRGVELGGIAIRPQGSTAPAVAFLTAATTVDAAPAVVLAPPVRGNNWIAFRGCCELATSHRGGTTAFNGTTFFAERFAIDFVQLDDTQRLISGPGNQLASYRYYGAPVYAVANGKVVSARNTEPDQVPGTLPADMSVEMAGGNAVLLDIGGGRFAFYAHLRPGSVRVQAGERVRSGDVIGAIGNSGKSIGPHLHFHVIDRGSPLAADGPPFVFAAFTGQGTLPGSALERGFQGLPIPIDRSMHAGAHRNRHPLNNQIIDFAR